MVRTQRDRLAMIMQRAINAADKDILITLPAADEVIADIIDGMNALPAHIAG